MRLPDFCMRNEDKAKGKILHNKQIADICLADSCDGAIFMRLIPHALPMGLILGKAFRKDFNAMLLCSAVISLLLISGQLSAQENHPGRKADTLELVRLEKAFDSLFNSKQSGAARTIADSMIILANRSGIYKYVAAGYFNLSLVEKSLDNTEGFTENLEKSIPWFLKGGEPAGAAMAHTILGQAMMPGNQVMALEHFSASLEIRQQLGDSAGMAGNLVNAGDAHYNTGNMPDAENYYRQAAKIAGLTKNDRVRVYALTNLGEINLKMKRFEVSRDYLKDALALQMKTGNKRRAYPILKAIGTAYLEEGKTDSARASFEEALVLISNTGAGENELLQIYTQLGMIAKAEGDTATAGQYFRQTLNISRLSGDTENEELALSNLKAIAPVKTVRDYALENLIESLNNAIASGDRNGRLKFYAALRDLHNRRGNNRSANAFNRELQALEDTIQAEDRAGKLALLKTRYEAMLSEKEMLLAARQKLSAEHQRSKVTQRRNTVIALSASLILSLAIIAILLLLLRKRKKNINGNSG